MKARGQILKRVQDDVGGALLAISLLGEGLLALAIGRLKDGKLNSRGFSNPWNTSRFIHKAVCKDGDFNTEGLSSPRTRCRSAFSILPLVSTDLKVRGYSPFGHPVFADGFLILPFISTGSRTRGYSPSASRLSDALVIMHRMIQAIAYPPVPPQFSP